MKNYKDLTDIELFIKIEKYDPHAVEEVYSRYSPILFPLISRIISDRQIAEEIMIDVFISLWRKIDLFNFESGNTYSWLITLARNKAVHVIREKHSAQKDESMDEDEYDDFYILPDLDDSIDALDLVSAIKKRFSVEEASKKLTEAQKYVLYLSYYDAFTVNEIADKLNIPITTIRSKIMISLHGLKDHLLGTSTNLAEQNDLKEMIASYAVGCMDNENYSYLKKHKKDGGYLPENELGKLQYIITLLPLSLKETDVPEYLLDRLGNKLLETHKKILVGSLPDRRITKDIEESKPEEDKRPATLVDHQIQEAEPESPKVIEQTIHPKYDQQVEEKDAQYSKSKLFWIFNFILLAGLLIFSFLLSNETSELSEKVESMKRQLITINSETSAAKEFITEHMNFVDFFNNPDILITPLRGGKENPKSFGRFFLSLDAGEGLLELKKMPKPGEHEFYTFWMLGKSSQQNLSSFSSIPDDKYIKITQIPNGPRENVYRFVLTMESNSAATKPSARIYLSGILVDP